MTFFQLGLQSIVFGSTKARPVISQPAQGACQDGISKCTVG